MTQPFDPYTPSYAAAAHWMREAGYLAMRTDGRVTLAASDRAAGFAVLARLLWHVPGDAGGFLGLSDLQLGKYAKRLGLTEEQVTDAQWNPGQWPRRAPAQQAAA